MVAETQVVREADQEWMAQEWVLVALEVQAEWVLQWVDAGNRAFSAQKSPIDLIGLFSL